MMRLGATADKLHVFSNLEVVQYFLKIPVLISLATPILLSEVLQHVHRTTPNLTVLVQSQQSVPGGSEPCA